MLESGTFYFALTWRGKARQEMRLCGLCLLHKAHKDAKPAAVGGENGEHTGGLVTEGVNAMFEFDAG